MLQILFQRYLSPALSPARSFSYIWLSSQLWVSRCSVYIHINVDLIHEIAFVPPPPPPLPHTQCHGSGTVTFWWWSKRSHYTSLCWVRVGNFTNVSTPSSLYVHILLLWASAEPALLTARIGDLAFRVAFITGRNMVLQLHTNRESIVLNYRKHLLRRQPRTFLMDGLGQSKYMRWSTNGFFIQRKMLSGKCPWRLCWLSAGKLFCPRF